MSPDHLDQLGQQLKLDKSAACRRAIERILAMIKKRCDEGVYQDPIQAELDCRGTGHLPEIEKCFEDSRPQNGQGQTLDKSSKLHLLSEKSKAIAKQPQC